jgi:antitoxin MazE
MRGERDYNVIMRVHLVQIGNSRGVRIPKALLEQTGLRDEVEMEVRGSQLVIRAAKHPRDGWDDAFAAMAARGDDELLDPPSATKWDETEWEW